MYYSMYQFVFHAVQKSAPKQFTFEHYVLNLFTKLKRECYDFDMI